MKARAFGAPAVARAVGGRRPHLQQRQWQQLGGGGGEEASTDASKEAPSPTLDDSSHGSSGKSVASMRDAPAATVAGAPLPPLSAEGAQAAAAAQGAVRPPATAPPPATTHLAAAAAATAATAQCPTLPGLAGLRRRRPGTHQAWCCWQRRGVTRWRSWVKTWPRRWWTPTWVSERHSCGTKSTLYCSVLHSAGQRVGGPGGRGRSSASSAVCLRLATPAGFGG